ncbi:hypothetical protein PC39_05820 [Salinisphaera sp. PC39]|uniref:CBS domain-containing protein n=1 Tax=Salinisphaera sp. PC39 TaxID=1304156 RepID=UPI00333FF20C
MKVGSFCNRDPVTVRRDTEIREAARSMRTHHVGALVVVDGGRPVGIVTDRDLVIEVLAGDVSDDKLTIGDVMTQDVGVIEEDEGFSEALVKMAELGARRLPVVDARGHLVGMVSLDDILECYAELTDRLRSVLGQELWRETYRRR